jgi:hypothetical protein
MARGATRRGKDRGGRKQRATLASSADRHSLYQEAVQCVEAEIDFVDDTFLHLRGRKASVLREDFCGTANTACEWVLRRRGNRAIGVDLDAEVQAWGLEHNAARLAPAACRRLTLIEGDVLKARTEPVDVVLAMNFSYWIFRDRRTMRRYFRRVRESLVEDGIFFLDAYGGYESYRECRERTPNEGFTYIWDQAAYNPIDGEMTCHIHFSFPDGSRIKRAFTYHWRMWTLPEIREILVEAGFRRVTVYWEGTDEETGEGNGEFEPAERGDADPAWIAYISAER